jgi:hypothetical protein
MVPAPAVSSVGSSLFRNHVGVEAGLSLSELRHHQLPDEE